MVWLHGGGFVFGSAGSPMYDGGNMARDGDVVVVGVNHRLNAFGYTYLGNGVDERFALSGNVGQLDLVAALQWVRDNIAAFGGDPDNVTIFGQSGGGGQVAALIEMELAQGLFHKAIIMSGSILRFHTPDDAAAVTARLYKEAGVREGDVESLQKVPTKTMSQFMAVLGDRFVAGEPHPLLKYGPVVDGHVLAEQCWWDGAPGLGRSIIRRWRNSRRRDRELVLGSESVVHRHDHALCTVGEFSAGGVGDAARPPIVHPPPWT